MFSQSREFSSPVHIPAQSQKVLRNHPDIGDETRERVRRRMKELNYQPNLAARSLVTGKTYSVGFVVPDLMHPFFAEMAKGLSGALREHSYGLLIASSQESPDNEVQAIEQMLARRVDAVLIASAQSDTACFQRISERNVPYILVDRSFLGHAANFIGVDDEKAGFIATRHLMDRGCRRVAHIRGPAVSTAEGRLAGYLRALDGVDPVIVREDKHEDAASSRGFQAMVKLLQSDRRPDGVFCFNDPSAMGAMHAILESGLRIPEDIAIAGCGNLNYAPFLRVPLTSIDQSSLAMGERAARMALAMIESKKPSGEPESVLLEPALVERASTRR
ncbi:MAG: LacI family transcriptional regulator [Acidobacteria bacterium]|nr:LacI family transcriptional regulator [Acidobacteriota bacterium]